MSVSKPLTREFLISRKVCCGNGCFNCPYSPKYKRGSVEINDDGNVLKKDFDKTRKGG